MIFTGDHEAGGIAMVPVEKDGSSCGKRETVLPHRFVHTRQIPGSLTTYRDVVPAKNKAKNDRLTVSTAVKKVTSNLKRGKFRSITLSRESRNPELPVMCQYGDDGLRKMRLL